ncbi:MAG: hypothetical protein WBJ81_03310 [Rickettsiales bacterium]
MSQSTTIKECYLNNILPKKISQKFEHYSPHYNKALEISGSAKTLIGMAIRLDALNRHDSNSYFNNFLKEAALAVNAITGEFHQVNAFDTTEISITDCASLAEFLNT